MTSRSLPFSLISFHNLRSSSASWFEEPRALLRADIDGPAGVTLDVPAHTDPRRPSSSRQARLGEVRGKRLGDVPVCLYVSVFPRQFPKVHNGLMDWMHANGCSPPASRRCGSVPSAAGIPDPGTWGGAFGDDRGGWKQNLWKAHLPSPIRLKRGYTLDSAIAQVLLASH